MRAPRFPGARHPLQLIVWLTAIASLAIVVYGSYATLRIGSRTKQFGWFESNSARGVHVNNVPPEGPAAGMLAVGDRILALNGDAHVAVAGTGFHRREIPAEIPFQLRFSRAGIEHEVQLTAVWASDPTVLQGRLIRLFEAVVWCAVGIFIGLSRPDQPIARLGFFAAIAVGFVFLSAAVPLLVLVRLSLLLNLVHPAHLAIGYHFFYRFPAGIARGRFWTALLFGLYAVTLTILAAKAIQAAVFFWNGAAVATAFAANHPMLPWIEQQGGFVYAPALVAIVSVAMRNYRLVNTADQRRRVRWIIYGSVIGLGPMLVLNLISIVTAGRVPVFGATPTLWSAGLLGNLCTALVPLSFSYAIVKHRIFDITVVLRQGMQYLLARNALQALLVVPVVAMAFTIVTNRDRTITQIASEASASAFWAGAAVVSLRFRRPLRTWVDRKFFREQYDRDQILLALIDQVERLDSVPEVAQLVSVQLERALHPKSVYVWYRERDRGELRLAYSSGRHLATLDLPPDSTLAALAGRNHEVLLLPSSPSLPALSESEQRLVSELGIHVVVPIVPGGGQLAGLLMLGEKKSEEPYTPKDCELLLAVARHVGLTRENARLKQRVGEEERIKHEVLARLDKTLLNLLKQCPVCGRCFDSSSETCPNDGQRLTLTLPVERTIDRRYRIDRLVGRGGMGVVYQAFDLRLDRRVAIKLLIGSAVDRGAAIRRFEREARAVAKLTHPNIVALFDYGMLAPDGAYLVMEYVDGLTLRAELDRLGALPPPRVADWFEQILDGLAAAHAARVVHRDLKPENVIGETSPERFRVKVLDFGLAKIRSMEMPTRTSLTHDGVVLGTLGYMSPEQLGGQVIDERTDIFAAGVMVVEALTGRRVFAGSSFPEMVRSVLNDDVRLPGTSPDVDRLNGIVRRCLAKDPRERHESADEFRNVLIPALRSCPPLAAFGSSSSAITAAE